ncbi:MFS transporter [Pseudomonas helleri]|uniref:MFS transporter n=1 Tax=Pseudomonas helleri TaxID=1608996 RepID=UPI0028EADFB6|nr:MFS transporter [Pseudomonas helleri]
MNFKSLMALAIALLMFPQIAQTLYSPALSDIGLAFAVEPQVAAQTLSVFFLAFAVGVVVWGRLCDRWGRRPTMLAGLTLYAAATGLGLAASKFEVLLLAQAMAAFGASVGSVVTQTVLRDRYRGPELAHVFSLMGIALAASPALGLFAGASLVQLFGYRGVLAGLLLIALVLCAWCLWALPETRPAQLKVAPLLGTLRLMLIDLALWRSVVLVSAFNVALFSFYSLGPFVFQRAGLTMQAFGYSGVVLALGSGLGATLNKYLLRRGVGSATLVLTASVLMLMGALLVWLLERSGWFVVPMLLVVLAFGMAIPNLLSTALMAYQDRLGTAGALFGLFYYLIIGASLVLVALGQQLGVTLLVCASVAVVFGWQLHELRRRIP